MGTTYGNVTDQIVTTLEAGVKPWVREWEDFSSRPLRHNGEPYRGVNVVNLWAAAMRRGFQSPYWMTYRKATELKAQVKKGAKSELAFYYGTTVKKDEHSDEDNYTQFMKYFRVFNVAEIEGLPERYYAPTEKLVGAKNVRIPHADTFVANTGAKIIHGGGKAFYVPSVDEIHLPEFETFHSSQAYYGVAFHELVHWTSPEQRADRKGKLYDNDNYAFEELVAELGAAFLSADLRVSVKPRDSHISYLQYWLAAMKADSRAIFIASRHAEKAATYLHSLQPGYVAAKYQKDENGS